MHIDLERPVSPVCPGLWEFSAHGTLCFKSETEDAEDARLLVIKPGMSWASGMNTSTYVAHCTM